MKSVLVDFLVGAGIKPTAIVSYNHLGNNDGMNLSAPQTFRSKVRLCKLALQPERLLTMIVDFNQADSCCATSPAYHHAAPSVALLFEYGISVAELLR